MIRRRAGVITSVRAKSTNLTEVTVSVEGREERALNFDSLTGGVEAGDNVLLNTTAVAKGLGTGGYHFVMAAEGKTTSCPGMEGHIMKLRYTPFQVKVLSVEEAEHPGNQSYRSVESLGGTPVVVGSLHSMIAPAAAAFKYKSSGKKVAYLMTDGAALPIWISNLVRDLKEKRLVDETITCGHAFGGDYEAINVYSGLLWAKANGAELIIAAMGPGVVGSSTEFGHTAVEQGEIINAVNILGGRAIAIPRISFADARERHRGISHHTRTALGRVALTGCTIPLPIFQEVKKTFLRGQLKESGIYSKHEVVEIDTGCLNSMFEAYKLAVTTMGRSLKDDPEFFHTACAAGIYAARLLQPGADEIPDRFKRSAVPAQH